MKVIKVRDAMTSSVVRLSLDDTVHEAAGVLAETNVGGAPVVEDGRVVGMLTESDIVRVVAPVEDRTGRGSVLDLLAERVHAVGNGTGPRVRDAMSTNVHVTYPSATLWQAASEMQRHRVRRLPVVDDDGYLVGIVSHADIVRVVGRADEAIRGEIVAAVESASEEVGSEALRSLDITVEDGAVTIRGRADGRWAKRLASELAAFTPGAFAVRDEVRLSSDGEAGH
jgi:CBS domain-containing protein